MERLGASPTTEGRIVSDADDLREKLAAIAEMAPDLRRGGVLRLRLDDIAVTLAPFESAVHVQTTKADDERHARAASAVDPLDDPDTYGTGRVPGYDIDDLIAARQSERASRVPERRRMDADEDEHGRD